MSFVLRALENICVLLVMGFRVCTFCENIRVFRLKGFADYMCPFFFLVQDFMYVRPGTGWLVGFLKVQVSFA